MSSISRMKMARPSVYSTLQKVARPSSMRPGIRSYTKTETPRCCYLTMAHMGQHPLEGFGTTPLLTNSYCRSLSQTATLHAASPATQIYMDDHESLPEDQATSLSPSHDEKWQEQEQPQSSSTDESISSELPKQSSHTTHILFETIAPHVEQRTLQQLTSSLARIVSRDPNKHDTQDRAGKEASLKRRLDLLFEPGGGGRKKGSSSKDTVKYSWGIKGHPWLKETLYSYLVGKRLVKPYEEGAKLPFESDPTYPPNQNQHQHDKHLDTLIKARDVSLHHPIFWTDKFMRDYGFPSRQSGGQRGDKNKLAKQRKYQEKIERRHSLKSEDQLQLEAETLLKTLMLRLPPPHFQKVMRMLERYTQLDTTTSANSNEARSNANSWYIDDGSSSSKSKSLPELPKSKAADADLLKHTIPVLGKSLSECSGSHSHLVAIPLGHYFYMDLTMKGHRNEEDDESENDEDKWNPIIQENKAKAAHAIRKQRKLHGIQKKYNKMKNEFVAKMMELQHEFATEKSVSDTESGAGRRFYEDTAFEGDSMNNDDGKADDDDGDNDVSSDFSVDEFKKAQAPYSHEARKKQQDDLTETLLELQKLGLRKDDKGVKKMRGRGRPKKDHHLGFTAIRIEEEKKDDFSLSDTESTQQTENVETELEERIVFINNLPIDTTDSEIDQIYSRCGPLESIQLFNLRPDLDPGPLSKSQQKERRRKKTRNKNSFLSYNEYQKQRPRTPVYGMLRFQTAEGYKVATSPELCIFGTVIKRHPVLSIKHHDLTTLYLEQIPENLYAMDLEYKLAQLLHPHNVHIMLDGMKGVGLNGPGANVNGDHQEYSKPSSCQVKFDDFHTAYQAYQWVREGVDGREVKEDDNRVTFVGDECQVHWFQTPENSMEYWTRELSF